MTIISKPRLPSDGGRTPLGTTSIATDRFDLLPLTVQHAAEMATVLADPALHAFIGGEPLDEDALRDRYARLAAGSPDPAVSWFNWVVSVRDEGRLAGTVQATVAHEGPVAEVAWVVGTPWQGRGVATEAARGLVAWLREAGVRTVVAHIHPDHAASAAVAASAGLSPTDVRQDGEIRWTTPPEPPPRRQAQPGALHEDG
ncbi:GNAT family N-acetyltransferase [Nonomuraea indica]|uniref:GNAT family N-acetyltransferase n=1 Tax=Nonomuraea indica TaxID=1581193 RepID=A0ABW8A232_9ACTN